MPLGYRTIFSVSPGQDPARVAAEQFRPWLRKKNLDADAVSPGVHDVGVSALLAVTELDAQDGSHTLRYRLTETARTGEWTTTLTTHGRGREGGWIWVDVTAPPHARDTGAASHPGGEATGEPEIEDPQWTAVPRLVRDILSVTDARDSELILSNRPTLVGPEELDDLIAAICDPDRRGSAMVAAPVRGGPLPVLIDHTEELTRESVGLAGVYVLDEDAAWDLRESFGRLHAVPGGAIRTFLPGADPASAVDGRRHRILMANTIATQPLGKLVRTLGWASRNSALNLPLPRHVSRLDRFLSREEPAAALRSIHAGAFTARTVSAGEQVTEAGRGAEAEGHEAVREATEIAIKAAQEAEAAAQKSAHVADDASIAPVEEAATAAARDITAASEALAELVREFAVDMPEHAAGSGLALVGQLRQFLAEGRSALRGQQEMSRRVASLQGTLEEAEDARDTARSRLEEEQMDHAITQYDLIHLKAETSRLRAALAAAGRSREAWTETAEAPQPPDSFAELLDRLKAEALPRVAFTGDQKPALELDDLDPWGTWASKTWEILRVLDGYVEAHQSGEFKQGVHAYLSSTPPGRPGYSTKAHAAQESDTVMNSAKFSQLRTLPVPPEVRAESVVFMGAHFRIARMGLISPRMHYYDDAARTEKIYVGYIGRHLPNKQTN